MFFLLISYPFMLHKLDINRNMIYSALSLLRCIDGAACCDTFLNFLPPSMCHPRALLCWWFRYCDAFLVSITYRCDESMLYAMRTLCEYRCAMRTLCKYVYLYLYYITLCICPFHVPFCCVCSLSASLFKYFFCFS